MEEKTTTTDFSAFLVYNSCIFSTIVFQDILDEMIETVYKHTVHNICDSE